MKKAGTSENWGGNREGAGRKAKPISEQEKRKLLRALKSKAKKEGKTWQDLLATVAYESGEDHRKEQMSAIKLVADILIVKESHQVKEEHKYQHGIVELPPLMPKKDKEVATA